METCFSVFRQEKIIRSTFSLFRALQYSVGATELLYCILELTGGNEEVAVKAIIEGEHDLQIYNFDCHTTTR